MAGDPLRDLDSAARIHVFGKTRRTEDCDNKLVLLESLVGEVRKHIDASGVFC